MRATAIVRLLFLGSFVGLSIRAAAPDPLERQFSGTVQPFITRGRRPAQHIEVIQLDAAVALVRDDRHRAECAFAHVEQLVRRGQIHARQRARR